MNFKNLEIIVLAAGKASRMGKPKQLLQLKEKTLLETVLQTALQLDCGGVSCVLGAYARQIIPSLKDYPVNVIYNPNWEEGLSSSIRTGIEGLEVQKPDVEAVLLILGDQPQLSISHLERMIQALKRNKNAIIASDYGGFSGVPVLFAKAQFNLFKNLHGDGGAKELLNDPEVSVHAVRSEDELQDIDTPADYEQYLKNLLND